MFKTGLALSSFHRIHYSDGIGPIIIGFLSNYNGILIRQMTGSRGRKKNLLKAEPQQVTLPTLTVRYLEQLVLKGHKGKNTSEAIDRIVSEYIDNQIRNGYLTPIAPTADDLTGTDEQEEA